MSQANVFQLFPDRPENFDAWDIDRQALDNLDHVEELSAPTSIEVVDEGPLVGILHPNEAGHRQIAALITPVLAEVLNQ